MTGFHVKFNTGLKWVENNDGKKCNVREGRTLNTLHKKMKFFIKDFFSKCDLVRSFLDICFVE